MDEATSALDYESEKIILNNMHTMTNNKNFKSYYYRIYSTLHFVIIYNTEVKLIWSYHILQIFLIFR